MDPHIMRDALHFELRLEERLDDRVFVSVVLAPARPEPAGVDGVSVQMVDRRGDPLGARMVLPISGAVGQPLITTVEVRARGPIPAGSRVVGLVWAGRAQLEAACPCDPGTQLEVHMRGRKLIPLGGDPVGLRALGAEERAALARLMPWVNEPMRTRPPSAVLEPPPPSPEELAEEVAAQYDLDEEDAALLRELLGEE